MKKALSLIFTLFMLFSFAVSVNAEEFNGADLFTIDLPDGFEQTGADASNFAFENENGDKLTVSYSDNTRKNDIFSPADMSKKEIEKYTSSISEEAENVMKDQLEGFELKFLDAEKIKHGNGKTALVSHIETTVKIDGEKSVHYQTMYEFGGVNYKYTFTHTTSEKDNQDSFNKIFETINIFEAETQSNLDKFSTYAVAAIMALLVIGGIVRFIRTPEKRAQGKLK